MTDPDGHTLFNHDAQHCYSGMDTVPGFGYYASRVLALSSPGDTVQLPAELADDYPHVMEHYNAVGLDCARNIVWTLDPAAVAELPGARYSVYRFRSAHHRLRPNERRLAATNRFENKNRFLELCRYHGFPVPETRFFGAGEPPRLDGLPFPVLVKQATDAGGASIRACTSLADVREAAAMAPAEYQIQESLTASAFLNVLYRAGPGGAEHVATTTQIMRGFQHAGNQYPARTDPRPVTDPVADVLAREGLEEMLGIDVAVTEHGLRLLEVNARYNSASYPAGIARVLGAQQWTALQMRTRFRTVRQLARSLGELRYDPRHRAGVVLVNWGPVIVGEIGVLLISDDADLTGLGAEVAAALR
ncbi:ATP-grasp domain-containing protein [Lolliginicoccus levis]|uniref:ATP-grasp domain-containing protein n=1 Tax=Lolliginicoccus levis TaxID=2919542 RepID=UPI00241E4706|nr:ATP-grasp domain-containing protein [Lolliginicoccus levis]